MSTKRKRTTVPQPAADVFDVPDAENSEADAVAHDSPTKPRGLRKGASTPASTRVVKWSTRELTTPTANRILPLHLTGKALVTPKKPDTPRRNAADRSAKRKSSRRILEKAIADEDDEEPGREDDIAERIIGDDGPDANVDTVLEPLAEEDRDTEGAGKAEEDARPSLEEGPAGETPVKRGRGRPKGSKNREITPPTDLPAHEWYFWINRPNSNKTSTNTFPSAALLNHSAYHEAIQKYRDPHAENVGYLHAHHYDQFPLWEFELNMGFSVLLYGYGDKMPLLKSWAAWLHRKYRIGSTASVTNPPQARQSIKGKAEIAKGSGSSPVPITIVLDAQHPALTPRTLLSTIADAALPSALASALPNPLLEACAHITSSLTSTTSANSPQIYLLINPIHAPVITHAPFPTVLSRLASHPRIHLLAAADEAHALLLWPQALKDAYNWVFHDGTTFVSYDSEGKGSVAGAGIVDTVNELLGRKGARGKGREGVRWVLRSLPENARGVYRILVTEVLSAADGDAGMIFGAGMDMDLDIDFGLDEALPGDEDEDGVMDIDGAAARGTERRGRKKSARREEELPAIAYRTIYSKAVEEFLCSSEMAFRGLLKEFVDHQMVAVKRDLSGQEALTIEMRKDELEGVLEDLTLAE